MQTRLHERRESGGAATPRTSTRRALKIVRAAPFYQGRNATRQVSAWVLSIAPRCASKQCRLSTLVMFHCYRRGVGEPLRGSRLIMNARFPLLGDRRGSMTVPVVVANIADYTTSLLAPRSPILLGEVGSHDLESRIRLANSSRSLRPRFVHAR